MIKLLQAQAWVHQIAALCDLNYLVIDLFHKGDQIWYSFDLMLISRISLAAMGTIQKNV